jgi:CheY-like chemotaxis protein
MSFALILSVGSDPQLLGTRELLLQSAGYAVVSARSVKEAVDRFLAGDFDLVLLCHSLSETERKRVVYLIRASGSFTLVVAIAEYTGQNDGLASATIESDPEQLLAGIKDLLTKQEQKRSNGSFSRTQSDMHQSA